QSGLVCGPMPPWRARPRWSLQGPRAAVRPISRAAAGPCSGGSPTAPGRQCPAPGGESGAVAADDAQPAPGRAGQRPRPALLPVSGRRCPAGLGSLVVNRVVTDGVVGDGVVGSGAV